MTAPDPSDQMALILAIDRVEEGVFRGLRDIARQSTSDAAVTAWLAQYPAAPDIPSTREWATSEIAREKIAAWLAEWNLDLPGLEWIGTAALLHAKDGKALGLPSVAEIVPSHRESITLAWEPAISGETRAGFVKRAAAAVMAHADRVEIWQRHQGFAPKQRKGRRTGQGVERWEMIARRIILRETYDEIGTRARTDKQTAQRMVRTLSDRLGVVLPSGVAFPSR